MLQGLTSYRDLLTYLLPGGPVVKNPHSTAEGSGLIPGQETKIPHVVWCRQKIFFF